MKKWRIKEFTLSSGKKYFKIQQRHLLLFWIYESKEFYTLMVHRTFDSFDDCIKYIRCSLTYQRKHKQTNVTELDDETIMRMDND